MTPRTQGLILAFLGAVVLRLTVSGDYLRFVKPWMRWPLVATALLLLLVAAAPLFGRLDQSDGHDDDDHDGDGHEHGIPRAAWLLLVPGLVVFLIAPPALGAYLADRRADTVAAPPSDTLFEPLPAGDAVDLDVDEYVWRAMSDDAATLRDRTVTLTGFVSGEGDDWYVTRVSIVCCAADASVARAQVADADSPPRDTWVEVTGTWEPGGTAAEPVISATSVRAIEAPENPYG